jgi:hypothetical protein
VEVVVPGKEAPATGIPRATVMGIQQEMLDVADIMD